MYSPSLENVIDPSFISLSFMFSSSFFRVSMLTIAPFVLISYISVNGVPVPLYILSRLLFDTKYNLPLEYEGEYSAKFVFIAFKFFTL